MAQLQPNYQRLADADSQTLVNLIIQLRDEMRVSATQTTERFDLLQTEMTILRSDVTAIHTRLDAR